MISLSNVSFTYPTAPSPIFMNISLCIQPGWTGIIGANGTGKSTLLQLLAGGLQPDTGNIHRPDLCVLCEQRTDEAPAELQQLLFSAQHDGIDLLRRLNIEDDWQYRWNTLSHGERKRAQIASAIYQHPDMLAVDEPTNHLDSESRSSVIDLLRSFKGYGVVVSHDRQLLDALCAYTVILADSRFYNYDCSYTQAMQLHNDQLLAQRKSYEQLVSQMHTLKNEYQHRIEEASKQNRKRSKRQLDRHDSDGRRKLDMVRLSGADGTAGRIASQLEGRLRQTEAKLSGMELSPIQSSSIRLYTQRSRRHTLCYLPSGDICCDSFQVTYPDLQINASDRISLTGANGSGKSTLLSRIVDAVGRTPTQMLYIPQEVSLGQSLKLQYDIAQLSDRERGRLYGLVHALGSNAEALMESCSWSPGETRKMLLAIGLISTPELIILDEPTNHLDLPSVLALENALATSQAAILLVSHDIALTNTLCSIHWHIDGSRQLIIQ